MQIDVRSFVDLSGVKNLRSGTVREIFDPGDMLLFVASDRISVFDVILPCAKR
jgi:phosphoribosylaminoimidazole-succinocarboxamide synthase